MLTPKYGTTKQRIANRETVRSVTYYGTKSEVDELISARRIGAYYDGMGTLITMERRPGDGLTWEAELEFRTSLDDSGQNTDPETATGPNSQRLTVRMLSLPIEGKRDEDGNKIYQTRWNHYLIGCGTYSTTVPEWWETAQDTFINPAAPYFGKYRWIRDLSEIPTERDVETGDYWQVVKSGETVCEPTKPGVDTYDWAVYEITESAKHNSKNAAGWAAARAANTIVARPELGDFGITAMLGGDWKIDAVDISYDGRHWIASRTTTKSGDSRGWDTDLYKRG